MIICCPECNAKFAVPDDAIGVEGRKVKCAKCGNKWHQAPPPPEDAAPPDAIPSQEVAEVAPIDDGANLPVRHVEVKSGKSNRILVASFSVLMFLFTASVVGGNGVVTTMPFMSFYYKMFGIYNTQNMELYNISVERSIRDKRLDLLVKGIMFNKSAKRKEVPSIRITVLDKNGRPIRSITFDSSNAILEANEKIDFQNKISRLPLDSESVVIDMGNSFELVTR